MPHFTYILYSPSRKAFYKGRTTDMDERSCLNRNLAAPSKVTRRKS
mgnify:CR=1